MGYEKNIDEWIYLIKGNHIEHCKDQELMLDNNLIPALERPDVYVDAERIEKGLSLQKYFPYKLLAWERFQFAVIVGMFLEENGELDIYFNEIWNVLGRGTGKNGFIDFLALYFISQLHGVKGYNVDLIANGEDQASTSIEDLYRLLDQPVERRFAKTLASNFRWTHEKITGKKMQAEFRLNTTSVRSKDSKRTGCVIFDEKHMYRDRRNMNTLTSGLGKMKWARSITFTSDGHERGGVLDEEKEQNEVILREWNPQNRTLVNWFRIEEEEEWKDIRKIVKAVPSLADPSFRTLKKRIEAEIQNMPNTPDYYAEFLAKRCNFPISDPEKAVAEWDDILHCTEKAPFEPEDGMTCVGGIDYTKTNDFLGCVLLFRKGDEYVIKHKSYICARSRDLQGIKAPLREWEKQGICEFVDDVEIPLDLPAAWLAKQAEHYHIAMVGIDNFRWSLLSRALKSVGFDIFGKESKNVWLVRPSDIMKASPAITRLFSVRKLYGFDRMMCWYTNNTKAVMDSKGNVTYGKIEPRFRKTDGFQALVHAMCCVEYLPEDIVYPDIQLQVLTY